AGFERMGADDLGMVIDPGEHRVLVVIRNVAQTGADRVLHAAEADVRDGAALVAAWIPLPDVAHPAARHGAGGPRTATLPARTHPESKLVYRTGRERLGDVQQDAAPVLLTVRVHQVVIVAARGPVAVGPVFVVVVFRGPEKCIQGGADIVVYPEQVLAPRET